MSEKLNAGQFPVLQRNNNANLFVQHQQSMPQRVTLPNGDLAETGYVKVTGSESIDLYALCQNNGNSKTLSVKAIAYVDEGDNLQVHPIARMKPSELKDPAYTAKGKTLIEIGHVTKLVGLRWGFNLKLDPKTGYCTISVDRESPIVGLKLQFD
ncbi:hypothetical protein MZD04_gp365 [Pseudomonas phage Psa21]|uniref:Uncharacterized protein n=1 Tax=Pseudomonas phage Psa21 TaxID=2530023 RepID=A0A481W4Y6_9CAUD|nr:hypothetical protein MZD04_gp365 [Pseudomonas phage Psa21]QBJ02891.1 hypothetical protein PSA21_365 [Pseudomonas phage Psa21]